MYISRQKSVCLIIMNNDCKHHFEASVHICKVIKLLLKYFLCNDKMTATTKMCGNTLTLIVMNWKCYYHDLIGIMKCHVHNRNVLMTECTKTDDNLYRRYQRVWRRKAFLSCVPNGYIVFQHKILH